MKNKEKKSSVIKKIKVILIEIYRRNAFHPKEDSEQREAYSLYIHVRVRACVCVWHTVAHITNLPYPIAACARLLLHQTE